MRDIKLYTDCEGWPVAQVTLSAVEVGQISMWLRRAAQEHVDRVLERAAETGERKAGEAICASSQEAGAWSNLHDLMDIPFWKNANQGVPCNYPIYPGDEEMFDLMHEFGPDEDETEGKVIQLVEDNDE